MYATSAVCVRYATGGVTRVQDPETTSTCSTSKRGVAYIEKRHATVCSTISHLVASVAVTSRNTLRVSFDIMLWLPLMIGGSDITAPVASHTTGYRGRSRISGR